MADLKQKVIDRLMYSAASADGWASDAEMDLDPETLDVTSVYVHGYIDIQHIVSEMFMALDSSLSTEGV